MGKLSYDELEREYRNALRREVQLRHRVQARDAVILRMKARLMGHVQRLDLALQELARIDERQDIDNDIHRHAGPSTPSAPSGLSGSSQP